MTTTSQWQLPTSQPPLSRDIIHVWRSSLSALSSHVEALRRCLSADETLRAERFRLPRLRESFIVARGTLRAILGRYLNAEPAGVPFVYGPLGKPALAGDSAEGPIHFNLSHSGDLVLYAFALGREVGVDVERHRPIAEVEDIVGRFFSAGERAVIQGLPDEQKPAAFFRYWTLKEAYLKARGTGLSSPLNQFEVTFSPAAVPIIRNAAGEESDWSCRELPCESGYAAAVAARGRGWRLLCWAIEGDILR